MSHSPLRMFKKFHDKCVLVSGQGPVLEIAKKYPFVMFCVCNLFKLGLHNTLVFVLNTLSLVWALKMLSVLIC